jgi:hypothetical protein
MRPHPVSFAAAAGLVATVCAVLVSAPAAQSHHFPAVSVSEGDNRSETRPVTGDFRGVQLTTSDNVIVRQGSPAAISISGPDAEVARTETIIEKGRLVIRKTGSGKMSWGKNQLPVVVTVTMPVIESLSVSSSGDLRTEGVITGTELAVSLAGSGDIHAEAKMSAGVSTSVAGSGDIQLSGNCASHTVRLAGSGDIKTDKLYAAKVDVKLSGSGDISVAASESLDVSISGSGDVRYAGKPSVNSRVTGSGSVSQL